MTSSRVRYTVMFQFHRYVNYRKGLQIRGVTAADDGIYTAQMMYGKIHVRAEIELKISSK